MVYLLFSWGGHEGTHNHKFDEHLATGGRSKAVAVLRAPVGVGRAAS